jgi:putative addiction module component (TIGR02574 family)
VDADLERLLAEAMKLSPEERAALAGLLIDSLEQTSDEDWEAAWAMEIAQRLRDLDEGRARLVPWSEVRKRLFER